MASFLVKKYSENDVQVTSISNVQSPFWRNVQPSAMIRYILHYSPKDIEIQRSKNFNISTSFGRSSDEEERFTSKNYVYTT